ncbi:glycosyltransferase family 4 protein [Cryobacterium breve]|uniref:Glycosyltransferase family 4 protein n=2 Tax=Microbacteriaceae TaxID=85023 RepID=A0ABY2J1K7_9MICO|nr:glycosyltransferase family 4 protein [Cryobacterium sp. TmT3-12]TFC97873.1 glycosyltransferase family 4 protein [Cryobacterium breve]
MTQGALFALVMVLILALGAPVLVKPLLVRLKVLDISNERSSHTGSAIRGAGLGPLLSITVGFALLAAFGETPEPALLLIILAVALSSGTLGWLEDLRGVPILLRAGLQLVIGVAGASMVVIASGGWWWTVPVFAIWVAGYINVANFMDGVNGMSGLHGAAVGSVFAVFGVVLDMPWLWLAGIVLALAFAGFLPWNLFGRGMFLGDVGSYLLGGFIGIIAVAAITNGVPVLSVLGPLAIYLADAGATLGRRILRGERWFEAHRGHTYQRLTDGGMSHLKVSLIVAGSSLLSGGLGIMNLMLPEYWALWLVLLGAIAFGYLWFGATFGRSAQWHSEHIQKVRVS